MLTRRSPGQFAILGGVAVAYVVAGWFGLGLAFLNASTTLVWPPAGIALAAMLILGLRTWPVIFVGALIVNLTTSGALATSLGIAAGNTLEALAGAWLVEKFAGGRRALERPRGIFLFTLLAGFGSTAISATIGTTSLAIGGATAWDDFAVTWLTWWLGDAGGDLVVAPLLLLWSLDRRLRFTYTHAIEVAALFGATVLVSQVAFGGLIPSIERLPLAFLCTPIFIWSAFRFGQRTSAAIVALVYGMAVVGAIHGVGSFALATPNQSLLLLQAFIIVSAVSTLTLAALVSERSHSEAQLRQMAVSDPLTALANYRHLLDVLAREIQRVDRTARPFAVVFLDVNGLKKINDQHGHLVGSRALWRVAEALRRTCRSIDTPARYGGDEFAIVLPEATEEAAAQVVTRVAEILATDAEQPAITISSGIAICPRDGTTVAELLAVADRAQYATKTHRPRTSVSGPTRRAPG